MLVHCDSRFEMPMTNGGKILGYLKEQIKLLTKKKVM